MIALVVSYCFLVIVFIWGVSVMLVTRLIGGLKRIGGAVCAPISVNIIRIRRRGC